MRESKNQEWKHFGETEIIKDNLNPEFKKCFNIFYQFEVHQYMRFLVIDNDSETKYEEIGCVETTLGAIAGSKDL